MITKISSSPCISRWFFLPYASSKLEKIWQSFKENIGGQIRDAFFLPLEGKLSVYNERRIQKEIRFFEDFWDTEKPLNPQLPYQEEIRKNFSCSKKNLNIEVNGKSLEIEYGLIESKQFSNLSQNLVCILGNTSLLNNNIVSIYPFLASYLEKSHQSLCPLPLRIIYISQYGTSENKKLYRPKTLEEAGLILSKTLKALSETKGPLKQIVAHSLGTIILASALKYAAHEKDLLPSHILFDRGPSSIEKASYHKLGDLAGWVTWKLAQFSGWDLDLGKEIQKHLGSRANSHFIATEVIHDSHFKGVSLPTNSHLKEESIAKLSFDFGDQLQALAAHHNLHAGFLDGYHLIPRNPQILQNHQSLTSLLMAPFVVSSPLTYLRSLF